jgi:hypothetical protein
MLSITSEEPASPMNAVNFGAYFNLNLPDFDSANAPSLLLTAAATTLATTLPLRKSPRSMLHSLSVIDSVKQSFEYTRPKPFLYLLAGVSLIHTLIDDQLGDQVTIVLLRREDAVKDTCVFMPCITTAPGCLHR